MLRWEQGYIRMGVLSSHDWLWSNKTDLVQATERYRARSIGDGQVLHISQKTDFLNELGNVWNGKDGMSSSICGLMIERIGDDKS